MKKIFFVAIVALLLQNCTGDASLLRVDQLKCNNLENPAGTGPIPVLSFVAASSSRGAAQTAYQVILSNSEKDLTYPAKCMWNTGKVSSPESVSIQYSGPPLAPATRYYWKVRLWDNQDKPSEWSKAAFFITGLYGEKDWSGARWIGFEEIPDSLLLVPGTHGNGNSLGEIAKKRMVVPYFRKEFSSVKKLKAALVFIGGLGHYELYINGKRQGDRFLSPGWTDYDVTCYYNTFDVTDQIRRGENAIGVIVGNGFYNINRERYRKLVIAYGAPKMIMKLLLRYSDGTEEVVVSDESWKTASSPVTFTSIYGGEDYDARLEQTGWNKADFDDHGWKSVILSREPRGKLETEPDNPLKVMQEFKPAGITALNDTSFVYDFGQNASGIISLEVSGKSGQKVRIIPAELIAKDSLVNQKASGSPYYFSYILKSDKAEKWTPRFTYYGFRYCEVHGAIPSGTPNPGRLPVITDLRMLHTRNSSPAAGSFRCSNELFNKTYDLINWAIKSNLASVATDCPHREKLGWLEQTHLMGNSVKYVTDIHNLFNKMIDDMIGAQTQNGLVPDIAPEYVEFSNGFRDSPEWGSACIILPWDLYEWYGDTDAMKRAYPMMKRYLAYLGTMSNDHILFHGLGDWYDLGPKFPGVAQLTPKSLTSTAIYYYDSKLLSKMAFLLGMENESSFYRSLADSIKSSFNREFFDPKTKVYSTGSQTAFAMPLFFGMVDDSCRSDVVKNLVQSIRKNNNALTAGDVGYRYLLRALEQEGQSQLIFDMNSRTDVPGYGYQLSKGATSLTESWAGLTEVSNNHFMLGHLMEWFYSGLAGIRQSDDSKAYEHVIISPEIVGDITWANASYRSVRGEIRSSWKKSGNELLLKVNIPVGSKATIIIPQSDPAKINDGKIPLNRSQSVSNIRVEGEKTLFDILSGEYIFRTEI
jgi:hypothetical protein